MFRDAMRKCPARNNQMVNFGVGEAAATQRFNGCWREAFLDQRGEIPIRAKMRNAEFPAQSGVDGPVGA